MSKEVRVQLAELVKKDFILPYTNIYYKPPEYVGIILEDGSIEYTETDDNVRTFQSPTAFAQYIHDQKGLKGKVSGFHECFIKVKELPASSHELLVQTEKFVKLVEIKRIYLQDSKERLKQVKPKNERIEKLKRKLKAALKEIGEKSEEINDLKRQLKRKVEECPELEKKIWKKKCVEYKEFNFI